MIGASWSLLAHFLSAGSACCACRVPTHAFRPERRLRRLATCCVTGGLAVFTRMELKLVIIVYFVLTTNPDLHRTLWREPLAHRTPMTDNEASARWTVSVPGNRSVHEARCSEYFRWSCCSAYCWPTGDRRKQRRTVTPLATNYVTMVPQELGARTSSPASCCDYRALDTLGEVAILFMVAAGVGLSLAGGRAPAVPAAPDGTRARRRAACRTGAGTLTAVISRVAATSS